MPLHAPSPGDFVIVKDKTRKLLIQVSSVADGIVTGTRDKDRAYNPQTAQCTVKDIMVNLGSDPELGSVYGVALEPFRKTIRHPQWGDVHLFHKLTAAQLREIKLALDRSFKDLTKLKIDGLLDAGNIAIEVRPRKGKNRGMYYWKQKGDTAADRLLFRVFDDPEKDLSSLFRECIAHEMGHALYWRGMTRKTRAKWLRLFEEFCSFSEHSAADVQRIGKKFLHSFTHVKEFRNSMAQDETQEDQVILFDSCIAQLCGDHRMSVVEINGAIDGEDSALIQSLWPKKELRYSDFEEELGEYAMTNVKEFFAEAMRLYVIGTKLPQKIRSAMEATLRMAPGIIGTVDHLPVSK